MSDVNADPDTAALECGSAIGIVHDQGAGAVRRRLVVSLLCSVRFWLLVAAILICSAATYVFFQYYSLAGIRTTLGPSAPLVTVPIHIVVSLTPFPSDVITIANGAVYGFLLGAVLSWVGWWLAALIEFTIGRRLGDETNLAAQRDKMPAWIRRFPVDHPVFLIFGRQIPGAGGHITTLLPGALGVSYRRFLWCSALGIIPGAVTLAAFGAGINYLRW